MCLGSLKCQGKIKRENVTRQKERQRKERDLK